MPEPDPIEEPLAAEAEAERAPEADSEPSVEPAVSSLSAAKPAPWHLPSPAAFTERPPAVRPRRAPDAEATHETYWGLREPAFANSPNPRFLYLSPGHDEALQRLSYVARQRKGCVLLTGEPGCGKTTLTRTLVHRLESDRYDVGMLTNPSGGPLDLLREVLYELGVDTPEPRRAGLQHRLHDVLVRNFRHERDTVLIIDEAQLIDDDRWFAELALLLNFQTNEQTLLAIVLAGSPELATRVQGVPPLDRRLSLRCHLGALDAVHTARYVVHRLAVAGVTAPIFSDAALEAVHEGTLGTPRIINDVCDGALRLGSLGGVREIDADLVRKVMDDVRPADTLHGSVRPLRRR